MLYKVGGIIILYRKELTPWEVELLKVIQQANSKTKIPSLKKTLSKYPKDTDDELLSKSVLSPGSTYTLINDFREDEDDCLAYSSRTRK